VKNFQNLEKVKSRFLKRVLGVNKRNKNTYVYRLAEEPLFVEELLTQYNLPPTQNFSKFLSEYKLEHESRFNVKFLEPPQCEILSGNSHYLKRIDMFLLDSLSMAITIKYVKKAMKNINVL
jgi:hypothetical protein